jgi:hypothetical protein
MAIFTEQQKSQILAEIDRIQGLRGLGIAFDGRGQCQVLRQSPMPVGLRTWVVLEETDDNDAAALASQLPSYRESHVGREFVNVALSCGSAGFAVLAVAGSAGAALLTSGSSLTFTVLSWSALFASSIQCRIAEWRLFNEWFDPNSNDELDSQRWYQITSDVLDGVVIAGGIAALGQAAQAAVRLGRVSGRSLMQILRGMTRAERKRLAEDVARYAGDARTRHQFIRLAREGRIPSIFSHQQVNRAVTTQLLSAISSGLSLGGSGAFGLLHTVRMHIVED